VAEYHPSSLRPITSVEILNLRDLEPNRASFMEVVEGIAGAMATNGAPCRDPTNRCLSLLDKVGDDPADGPTNLVHGGQALNAADLDLSEEDRWIIASLR